jgi:subfamily B ATP-binding cassette protein HlyB/CyaB
MDSTSPDSSVSETGLLGLATIARFHGVSVDLDGLRRELGASGADVTGRRLVAAARGVGLKAREVSGGWERLARAPLPVLVARRDGRYTILLRIDQTRALVQAPGGSAAAVVPRGQFEEEWAGRFIMLAKPRLAGPYQGRFGLAWFLPYIARHRGPLSQVMVASLVLQLFALLTPLTTQVVIDKVLVHRGLVTLDVVAVGMLLLIAFEGVLGGLRTYLLAHTTSRIDVELGMWVVRHTLRLPLAYFEARRVGDTVARIRELEGVRHFLTGPPLTAIVDTVFAGVFVAIMLLYNVPLTGVAVAALPAYAALSLVVTPLLRRAVEDRAQRGAESHAFLVESVRGIETVKAMAAEPLLERRWEEHLSGLVRANFRAGQLGQVAGHIASTLGKLTALAILWLGARAVMEGELTVGELIAFNMLASRVTGPVLRLVQLWQDLQQARVAVERLADLLEAPTEVPASGSQLSSGRLEGRIQFEAVSFSYRVGHPDALRELSFAIEPGEVVGIVGPSGSGKSTVAKLLSRLYVPQRGRVLVDGLDVAHCHPAWLRRHVAVVPQETTLFTGSVRENIAWADPGLPLDSVIGAAKLAGAHEFIMGLPAGYDGPVGEHGALLSGGQRQRLGLARALVMRPTILVLDEATSALDYESERAIERNLSVICRGRTVLVITHRLNLVRRADRVIVLEAGRLREQGNPKELLAAGGYLAGREREQQEPLPLRVRGGSA